MSEDDPQLFSFGRGENHWEFEALASSFEKHVIGTYQRGHVYTPAEIRAFLEFENVRAGRRRSKRSGAEKTNRMTLDSIW